MSRTRLRSRSSAWLALPLALLCAAPTVGDIGSCGQTPVELDLAKFTQEKERLECSHCRDCELTTAACAKACDNVVDAVPFPQGCVPLVHDGEVCLNALDSGSCSAYEGYVSDAAPTIPTECDFCPPLVGGGGGGGAE